MTYHPEYLPQDDDRGLVGYPCLSNIFIKEADLINQSYLLYEKEMSNECDNQNQSLYALTCY